MSPCLGLYLVYGETTKALMTITLLQGKEFLCVCVWGDVAYVLSTLDKQMQFFFGLKDLSFNP